MKKSTYFTKSSCYSATAALCFMASFNVNANLLSYGGFEPGVTTGSLAGPVAGVWGLEGSQSIVVGVSSGVTPIGTQMLQVGQTAGGAAQTDQQVTGFWAAGTTVTFEALFNASSAGTTAGLFFTGRNSLSGPDILSTGFATDFNTFTLDSDVNTWQTISVTGVLDVDVTVLRAELRFSTGNLSGGRLGFVDNASLTAVAPPAVPVPAAVWLFGSGLLGLVGVARRKV